MTNAEQVFSEFFGPGGGGGGGGLRFRQEVPQNDVFTEFFGAASRGKPPPIERTLSCSLEELYKGATKTVKVSRQISYNIGKTTAEETLSIEIKRGWKKGTKITFPEKGNVEPNVVPADIIFVIDEKPHSVFTRDGNDLVITKRISVAEALTDYTVHLTTLDGRSISIPINNVIHPNHEEVVPKEGMPIPKEPNKRGNLRIKFDVKFPTRVNAEQKALIKQAFAL